MLTRALSDRLEASDDPHVAGLLARIRETLGDDAERLRGLIAELDPD